jgi:hypothetical protein
MPQRAASKSGRVILESQPQRELDDSRIIRRQDSAKRGTVYVCIWVQELRMIEKIEEIGASLDLKPVTDRRGF